MHVSARSWLTVVGLCVCCLTLLGQPQKPTQTGSPPASSSTGALPGLNFPAATLRQLTSAADYKNADGTVKKGYAFVCTNLIPEVSSGSPFILQKVSNLEDETACGPIDASHPLKSGQKIVLVLETNIIDLSRVQNLNVNITFTQGTTISARSVRPSISGTVALTSLGTAHRFYLLATDRVSGDAIPQLSVSFLYDPPVPGQDWFSNTIYPDGSIVHGQKGHFFQALKGGMSGSEYPSNALTPQLNDDLVDNQCSWAPVGNSSPSGGGGGSTTALWMANYQYSQGAIVYAPLTNIYYQETAALPANGKCTSGSKSPLTDPEPQPKQETSNAYTTRDGLGKTAVEWQWLGYKSCPEDPKNTEWQHDHAYMTVGDQICRADSWYKVISPGTSGDTAPYFQNPDTQIARPKWVDIGVLPPSAVTSASATEIQPSAINLPLAQVHTLAYYNVDSGVYVSTIRVPSFAYTTPTTLNNGTPVQTSSTLLIDPVVTLTRYIWGFDAETKEHLSDWKPGISLSFSLASPGSNFYIGGSSEILRYVQVGYGFAVAKVPRLSPGTFAPSSSTTPTTTQVFAKGGYLGLTFNLSDFVKSLVKGGS